MTGALLSALNFETLPLGMSPNFHPYSILQYLCISGVWYHVKRQDNLNNQQGIPQMGEETCRAYRVLADLIPNPTQTKAEPALKTPIYGAGTAWRLL